MRGAILCVMTAILTSGVAVELELRQHDWDHPEFTTNVTLAAVVFHNTHRRNANLQPLQFSKKLEEKAHDLSEEMGEKYNCSKKARAERKKSPGLGVNIYTSLDEMSTTRADIIRVGCQWWYDEISDYEYPGPNNSFLYCSKTDLEDVRHFTQMMWNETERIGCAVHRCKNEEQEKSREEASLGICVYEPVGNQKDQPLFTQENYEGLCAAEPDRFKTCVPDLATKGCAFSAPIIHYSLHSLLFTTTYLVYLAKRRKV